jgi:fatty acid desaturase
MSASRPFFRYSSADALPALCGVGLFAVLLASLLCFDHMSWWLLVPAFLTIMWGYVWNLQCISHNFIHNPYFTSPWLNRLFGLMETVNLGVPHILYHHYHMNHHAGDNDKKGPDGTTKDWSSIYRYGTNDQPEAFWKYCLISFFRVDVLPVIRRTMRHGREHIGQLIAETVVLVAFWSTMLAVNWRFLLFFYLPSYYLGWVLSYAEGYLEHYRCEPGNYYANSVSSYNRLYNLFWFNNGYHQEHHWDPKCHWTRMHALHKQIEPQLIANHTRTLRGPHLTAFVEDWINEKWGTHGDPTQAPDRAA